MDTSRGKRNYNEKMEECNAGVEDIVEEEEEEEEDEDDQDDKRTRSSSSLTKRRSSSGGGGGMVPVFCQVENCTTDMNYSKPYHRRHKVCEFHAKAPIVIVVGHHQRFCQQCSRFHVISEFDDAKRSCRRRLAGHNERRRKSAPDQYHGEGSI